MDLISVIVSCLNEEKAIPLFYEEMEKTRKKDFQNVDFEYIFIDDGSTDNTLKVMKELAKKDDKVKYISFSRNFGKEAAMYAGLNKARGNLITLMDVDLQDPPFMLKEMYKSIKEEGFEQVGTRRVTRKGEPKIRSFFARCFYKIINKMSDVEMVDGARDYRLMTRKVVDAILSMKEYNRYSKGIFSFVGFKTKWLEYENVERAVGETKWSFWSLFKYAIKGIVAFTTTPLVISSVFGILLMFLALIFIVIIIVRTLAFGDPTSGWPSMACIVLLVSGVQLFFLGVIGQYLANTYQEVKKRPLYFISEEEDSDEK